MELQVIDKQELYRERDAKLAYEKFERFIEVGNLERARKMGWYLLLKHGIDVGLDGGRDLIGWDRNY